MRSSLLAARRAEAQAATCTFHHCLLVMSHTMARFIQLSRIILDSQDKRGQLSRIILDSHAATANARQVTVTKALASDFSIFVDANTWHQICKAWDCTSLA